MAEKTTTGRLIAAAGGIVLIISLFLTWYKIESSGFGASVSAGVSGWEAFGLIDLFLLIVGVIAIMPAALDIFDLEIELPVDMSVVTLGAGAAAVLLIVFRFIEKPGPDVDIDVPGLEAGVKVGFGLFIGLIASAAAAFGGFTQMNEDGSGVDVYSAAGAPPVPGAAPPPPPAAPPQAPPPGSMPPPPPPPPPAG